LKLVEELSDRAYHPHMTLAFKDLKEIRFGEYWDFIKQQKFEPTINVSDLALLKRIDGRWQVIQRIPLTTIA
jgi:2'-5' RNA ligase